jgi:tRNA dimethylallyltransferase
MNTESRPLLAVMVGPTAVGKTSTSIEIAHHFSSPVISADSRQFYREMKIGTAVPAEDQLRTVPHYFIGHLSIHDRYNVSRYELDVLAKLGELFRDHRVVIMTGGSGLYINAVCHGIDDLPDPDDSLRNSLKTLYRVEGIRALQEKLHALDPEYYHRVDLSNPRRLIRAVEVCLTTGVPYSSLRKNKSRERPFRVIRIGLDRDRNELYERIDSRTDAMMKAGFLEEAHRLFKYRHLNALDTVGYKELFGFLEGRIPLEKAVADIKTSTRRYAKRQLTWFRRDPGTVWFHPDQTDTIITHIGKAADGGIL